MKFLPPGYNVKEIEKSSKNKWRWKWLSEVDRCGNKWGNWLRKPDLSGVAFCECCTKTIKYGSSGKKAVTKHADDLNHQKNLKTVKSNEFWSCQYHPGGPVFHDAMKGWSCCKKRSTDFTVFLNYPGCTSGKHNSEKPKEPEKPKPVIEDKDLTKEENQVVFQTQRPPTEEPERPSADEPFTKLKVTIVPSLQKALDKHLQNLSLESNKTDKPFTKLKVTIVPSLQKALDKHLQNLSLESNKTDEPFTKLKVTIVPSLQKALDKHLQNLSLESNKTDLGENEVPIGTSCKNKGCKATYTSKDSDLETCYHHPGVAIFHEGMKYWSCCKRKTSDFTMFLDQAGCETCNHNWTKTEEKTCRQDWFQTSQNVNISVFAKLPVPETSYVEVNKVICNIYVVWEGGKHIYEKCIILRNPIIPEQSSVKMMGTKVEVILKKAEMFSWPSLELKTEQTEGEEEKNDS